MFEGRDNKGRFTKSFAGSPFKVGHKLNLGRKCKEETRKKISESNMNARPRVKIICKNCKKEIFVWTSKKDTAKYCCKKCQFESMRGKPTWNKGLKGFRAGEKRDYMPRGEKHWSYKGDEVQYRALHLWVVNSLGQPCECSNCGKTGTGRQMHWANKSGKYLRKLYDWIRLCSKCHGKYDSGKLIIN